jgi:hypothetical protein
MGERTMIGDSYRSQGSTINEAMDFSQKYALGIRDHQAALLSLVAPELIQTRGFDMENSYREFLIETMPEAPRGSPGRVGTHHFEQKKDRYKVLMPGVRKVIPRSSIQFINKRGRAYGFHLDNAWIENKTNGKVALVTVAFYINENRRFNDGDYQYTEISFPFLNNSENLLQEDILSIKYGDVRFNSLLPKWIISIHKKI